MMSTPLPPVDFTHPGTERFRRIVETPTAGMLALAWIAAENDDLYVYGPEEYRRAWNRACREALDGADNG